MRPGRSARRRTLAVFTAILLGSTAPVAAGSLRVDVHGRVSGVTGTAEVVLQESPPGQSFGRFFGSLGLTAFLDPFACVAGADLALCPDLPVTSTTSGDDGRSVSRRAHSRHARRSDASEEKLRGGVERRRGGVERRQKRWS